MEESYLDILSKNILNEVKAYIRHNNVFLDKEKEMKIDKKMIEVIKSIVLNDKDNIFEKKEDEVDKKKEINSNIMPSLLLYYVALYNDNLDLLHKLLDSEFNFGNYKYGKMKLFVLDKNISSKFDSVEYIELLKNNITIFENFYRSIIFNKNKEYDLNKVIEEFSSIIKKDNNIAKNKQSNKNEYERLLKVDVLTNFTEDEILKLNDTQKYILNNFDDKKDEESKLILDLIKNHNFSKKIICWGRFVKYFTKDEILKLSDEEINLIENLCLSIGTYDNSRKIEEIAIIKFKEIKKINPNFNMRLDSYAYSVFTIEQIMAMSESCCKKINILCSNYGIYNLSKTLCIEFSEKRLKTWIKEAYYKDTIKRNVKKLVKRK